MQATNILIDTTHSLQTLQKPVQKKTDTESAHIPFFDQLKTELSKPESQTPEKSRPADQQTNKPVKKSVENKKTDDEAAAARQSEKAKQPDKDRKQPAKTVDSKKADNDTQKKADSSKTAAVQVKSADNVPDVVLKPNPDCVTGKKAEHTKDEKKTGKSTGKTTADKADSGKITSEMLAWVKNLSGSQEELKPVQKNADSKADHEVKNSKKNQIELADAQDASLNNPALFLHQMVLRKDAGKNTKNADGSPSDDRKGTKKSVKITDEVSFDLTDLRTVSAAGASEKTKSAGKNGFVTNVKYDGQNNAQLTLNLANSQQQNMLSAGNQPGSTQGQNFQAMLARQLQDSASDFVRAGSIVLKDNKIGNINLILHPDSLGNVKINLQLTDKVITGHITVASREAYNAFHASIDSLRQAFTQSGFESAAFDLSWMGQGNASSGNGGNGSNGQNPAEMQQRSFHAYGDYTTGETVAAGTGSIASSGTYSVNIVA